MSNPPPNQKRQRNVTSLEVHPAAEIFPMLTADGISELAVDIERNGLQMPIVLCDGKLLDGRNRLAACAMVGVDPEFVDYDGDDPVGYVVSLNLHRRHLDTSQRAMVATRLATLGHGQRQDRSIDLSTPTQAKAAEMMNVSVPSVKRARKILDKGSPELIAAVESGETTVNAAAKIIAMPRREDRLTAAAAAPKAVRDEVWKEEQRKTGGRRKRLREKQQVEEARWRAQHNTEAPIEMFPVDEIIVGIRRRVELGDIESLAKSIDSMCLINAILITNDNLLVVGARRLAAVKLLGWDEIPVSVWYGLSQQDIWRLELAENECSEDYTADELDDAQMVGDEREADSKDSA